jgi:hypothetical protein
MRFAVSTTTHLAAVIVSIALGSPGLEKKEGRRKSAGVDCFQDEAGVGHI